MRNHSFTVVLLLLATFLHPAFSFSTYRGAIRIPTAPLISKPLRVTSATTPKPEVGLPSYKRLTVFTFTTVLIWLSEPLLSLVDTTIVGRATSPKNAIIQIAALGPATAFYDSLIYTTYFLSMAATNKLAPSLANNDYHQLRLDASQLLGLSLLFGLLVTLISFVFGGRLVGRMAGSLAKETIPLAADYVRIRAVVAPMCVVGFVAQSICLVTLDTRTPALAVIVASAANIAGDLLLAPRWGLRGAAVATAAATVASCAVLMREVKKITKKWAKEDASDVKFVSLPGKGDAAELAALGGPMFLIMMGKVACYSAITLRATSLGTLPLAAYNIMMRVYFFFACFGDSLGQTAQTFFPQVARGERNRLIRRLLFLSSLVGVANWQVSTFLLAKMGGFLAQDATIIRTMAEHSWYVGLAVGLHPFIMFLEGVLLAKRDLGWLMAMYLFTMVLHFGNLFFGVGASFEGLWRVLYNFQLLRLGQFAVRVWGSSWRRGDGLSLWKSYKNKFRRRPDVE